MVPTAFIATLLTTEMQNMPKSLSRDFCLAILGHQLQTFKELLKKWPNHNLNIVYTFSGQETTYLMLAAYCDRLEFIKPLIDAGAFIDYPDSYGQTPLFGACIQNNIKSAKLLLACGASVNCRKRNGWTPVATAAVQGFTELTRILIEAGADVNVEFEGMMTPLAGARLSGHQEVVKMLLKAGAK